MCHVHVLVDASLPLVEQFAPVAHDAVDLGLVCRVHVIQVVVLSLKRALLLHCNLNFPSHERAAASFTRVVFFSPCDTPERSSSNCFNPVLSWFLVVAEIHELSGNTNSPSTKGRATSIGSTVKTFTFDQGCHI